MEKDDAALPVLRDSVVDLDSGKGGGRLLKDGSDGGSGGVGGRGDVDYDDEKDRRRGRRDRSDYVREKDRSRSRHRRADGYGDDDGRQTRRRSRSRSRNDRLDKGKSLGKRRSRSRRRRRREPSTTFTESDSSYSDDYRRAFTSSDDSDYDSHRYYSDSGERNERRRSRKKKRDRRRNDDTRRHVEEDDAAGDSSAPTRRPKENNYDSENRHPNQRSSQRPIQPIPAKGTGMKSLSDPTEDSRPKEVSLGDLARTDSSRQDPRRPSILKLQSHFRGYLCRVRYPLLLEEIWKIRVTAYEAMENMVDEVVSEDVLIGVVFEVLGDMGDEGGEEEGEEHTTIAHDVWDSLVDDIVGPNSIAARKGSQSYLKSKPISANMNLTRDIAKDTIDELISEYFDSPDDYDIRDDLASMGGEASVRLPRDRRNPLLLLVDAIAAEVGSAESRSVVREVISLSVVDYLNEKEATNLAEYVLRLALVNIFDDVAKESIHEESIVDIAESICLDFVSDISLELSGTILPEIQASSKEAMLAYAVESVSEIALGRGGVFAKGAIGRLATLAGERGETVIWREVLQGVLGRLMAQRVCEVLTEADVIIGESAANTGDIITKGGTSIGKEGSSSSNRKENIAGICCEVLAEHAAKVNLLDKLGSALDDDEREIDEMEEIRRERLRFS